MLIAALLTSLALASKNERQNAINECPELWKTLQKVFSGYNDYQCFQIFQKFKSHWWDHPEQFNSKPLSDDNLKYMQLNEDEIKQWREYYPTSLQVLTTIDSLQTRAMLAFADYVPEHKYGNLIDAIKNTSDKELLENAWRYAPLLRLHFNPYAFQFAPNGYKKGPLTLREGRTLGSIIFKISDAFKISENTRSCVLFEHVQIKGRNPNEIYINTVEYMKDDENERKLKLTTCTKTSFEVKGTCEEKFFSKDAKFQLSEKTLKIKDKENQIVLNLTKFYMYPTNKTQYGEYHAQGFEFFNAEALWILLNEQTVEEHRKAEQFEEALKYAKTLPPSAKKTTVSFLPPVNN